jgi:predicted DNA-binding transcriptional regulator AlpA
VNALERAQEAIDKANQQLAEAQLELARLRDAAQQHEREPQYWLAGEVAAVVRLSEKSIYRLMKDDPTFPFVRVLGSVRFPRERVLRWLAKRTQGRP